MPVSFARLRIAGFKSFAEPTILELLPGLTGVVGPNGCGKSNVVEALRWAMGENSARSLRGGEMDDVIFAGTVNRASRNIAEVVLHLEDAVGFAPPPWQDQPELQISRRIERGQGSSYRVNGREARARDVQTLFADLASGARSSGMVSQGRVSAIVNARPDERRSILEEAAGITGLHARRHEAELKLRAAEANLARAEDVCGQIEAQLGNLRRQARQANRYRTLSGTIRDAEMALLSIQHGRAEAARKDATAALETARAKVAEAQAAAQAGNAASQAAGLAVPPLREAEAVARTILERHRLAGEQLAAEAARANAALSAAQGRAQQIARDLSHAQTQAAQSDTGLARLDAEQARLAQAQAAHPAQEQQAAGALATAQDAARDAEAEANRATEQAAALNASTQATAQALAQAESRARRLTDQLAQQQAEADRVAAQLVDPARLDAAEEAQQAAEQALARARAALEDAEQARPAAQAKLEAARATWSAADAVRTRCTAEAQALESVLAVKDGEKWPKMVDALEVPAGLEAALGVALGEGLNAAADPLAARHWRALPHMPAGPAAPGSATPLHDLLAPPPALARALGQVWLVADAQTADAAQAGLAPGQSLVSRDGGLWRWDGYVIRPGAPTEATLRLQQRNRLAGLRRQRIEATAQTAAAHQAREAAENEHRSAAAAEQQARSARRDAEAAQDRARTAAATLRAQASSAAARLAGLNEQLARLRPEQQDATAQWQEAATARAGLPDLALLRAAVDRARAAANVARMAENAARMAHDTVLREATAGAARLRAIGAEAEEWRLRQQDAAARLADLVERGAAANAELALLEAAPQALASRTAEAEAALAETEATHRRAALALGAAETRARDDDSAARAAEAALVAARETAIRAEGAAAQADHAWGTVAERILERLGAAPELPEPAALDAAAEDHARRRFERLQKERDEMGPVNLRAEIEAAEQEAQIATITAERTELETAIAKLRGAIGHLNREGRERLASVFAEVDRHFQTLFARMFGGGRAHLALVGSDDPLQAGLEIYAQPPGKKLATLSLLSGGEQALTALSLIFAVFRCNPAPVCVLDEVDAPLDDANVERFCNLLVDMVQETGTRFLVVTHHHMTMARMDRLYGVTMQERGISRLLSVDLAQAAGMVDPPRMAAE